MVIVATVSLVCEAVATTLLFSYCLSAPSWYESQNLAMSIDIFAQAGAPDLLAHLVIDLGGTKMTSTTRVITRQKEPSLYDLLIWNSSNIDHLLTIEYSH